MYWCNHSCGATACICVHVSLSWCGLTTSLWSIHQILRPVTEPHLLEEGVSFINVHQNGLKDQGQEQPCPVCLDLCGFAATWSFWGTVFTTSTVLKSEFGVWSRVMLMILISCLSVFSPHPWALLWPILLKCRISGPCSRILYENGCPPRPPHRHHQFFWSWPFHRSWSPSLETPIILLDLLLSVWIASLSLTPLLGII